VEAAQQIHTFADGFRIPCDGAPWPTGGPEAPILAPPAEEELTDRARATFDDIREFFDAKEVPNVFRAMARDPRYLTGTWRFYRACFAPGRLARPVKEAVAYATAVTTRSRYGIDFTTRRLRAAGVTDAGLMELMQVVDRFNGINKFADILLVEPDPWNIPDESRR
jgi:alkylhydroperoxidase family enzyme